MQLTLIYRIFMKLLTNNLLTLNYFFTFKNRKLVILLIIQLEIFIELLLLI